MHLFQDIYTDTKKPHNDHFLSWHFYNSEFAQTMSVYMRARVY